MKSFDLDNRSVAQRGLSLIAIAVVLSGAACAASDDDDTGLSGTGGSAAPAATGGSSAATGGAPAMGVAGKGGSGGGSMMMPPGGTGGMVATPGISGAGGGGGTGGMPSMDSGTPVVGNPESACLDGITNYGEEGPFTFKPQTEGSVKMWIPDVPAGCKVPVIHLANGTGASCGSYGPALERMASHGFLATCYENPNTGAGDQGVEALDTALTMFPDLAAHALGSTGHSQGGQASYVVLQKAEAKWGVNQGDFIYAGLAMEPASGFGSQPERPWAQIYGDIKSPMFMFSAVGSDGLVSQGWVMDAFNAMDPATEAYFWAAEGATHIPVPNGEEQEISIPWFRWKLLGDNAACKYFKAIPMTIPKWQEVASNSPKDCMP
jgi:hypothetical protein